MWLKVAGPTSLYFVFPHTYTVSLKGAAGFLPRSLPISAHLDYKAQVMIPWNIRKKKKKNAVNQTSRLGFKLTTLWTQSNGSTTSQRWSAPDIDEDDCLLCPLIPTSSLFLRRAPINTVNLFFVLFQQPQGAPSMTQQTRGHNCTLRYPTLRNRFFFFFWHRFTWSMHHWESMLR